MQARTCPALKLTLTWWCWLLQVPDLLTADQPHSSQAIPLSPAPSQFRRSEQSPRVLCTISPSVANSADSKRDALGATVSKRHWNSLREQVKKPPGQSLLERMQWAAAQQAKEATPNGDNAQAVAQDVELQGSCQQTPKEAPVRPPRPSGKGSKSRLAANRDRLLQAE
jgi:hypothetical protein